MKLLSSLAALAVILVVGCAPAQPVVSREDYLAIERAARTAMYRTYHGATKEQVLTMAEKTLTYSDDDIVVTDHREDGFYADRPWSIYAIVKSQQAVDTWRITAHEPQPGVVQIHVVAWMSNSEGMVGMIVPIPASFGGYASATMQTGSSPGAQRYYVSPPLYKLFYDRLDYFMGLTNNWAPCVKNIDKTSYIYAVGLENGLDPLCFMPDARDPTKESSIN
jgi:hypothetical protein